MYVMWSLKFSIAILRWLQMEDLLRCVFFSQARAYKSKIWSELQQDFHILCFHFSNLPHTLLNSAKETQMHILYIHTQ